MKIETQIVLFRIGEYRKFIQNPNRYSNYITPDIPISTYNMNTQENRNNIGIGGSHVLSQIHPK